MTSEIEIRRMTLDDVPASFAIDQLSASLYWPERSFRHEVEQTDISSPLVAVKPDGTICGFSIFWLILDEAHLANFAVHPAHRREGIGRALLWTGLQLLAKKGASVAFLEVRAGNIPAISLYKKTGFTQVSVRKKYYQDNHEDALLMNLEPCDYQSFLNRIVR